MQLNFISTKEKLPKNGEFIFVIKTGRHMMYVDSAEPVFIKCEWEWDDGDGVSSCCEDGESSIGNMPEEYKYLNILDVEGHVIWTNETNKWIPEIEHFWWMTQEEFDAVWKNAKH